MKKLKMVLLSVIGVTGVLACLFWLAFVIVAYRNEYLVFETTKNKNDSKSLYYEKDNIKYYSYGLEDIYVYDHRFVFNTNKQSMKDVIDDGDFSLMLSKLDVYRYNYGDVIESKYTDREEDFCVTKCYYDEDKIFYIFSDEAYLNICRWFK